ncbi:MAG: sugar-binding domain-containing protein, partial [Pirellulales bacterium]
MIRAFQVFLFIVVFAMAAETFAEWKPAEGPLMTRWSKEVSPDNVHAEYPRPQLVRDKWQNLNGLWDYAITPKEQNRPDSFDGKILVPFPVESALSGVMKTVKPDQRLWYRRRIAVPKEWSGQRIMLNFGAVDWHTEVWVNGDKVGEHKGGYTPFSFDITDRLGTTKSTNDELVIAVWDPTDASYQPRGKQVRKPGSIWYTAVTGIWQTVWLEPVAQTHVRSIAMTPDVDAGNVHLKINLGGADADTLITATVSDDGKEVGRGSTTVKPGQAAEITIPIADARLWSPDDPHLYDLAVHLVHPSAEDKVGSYFGMRKVHIAKDGNGMNRIFLNNKELFHFGPLDQGWWPDGLYTAPTDEALRYDIEVTKKLGMNMCRKHVKVEPARWYYWCDKLGLMVWQDMPSGDGYIKPNEADLVRSKESSENYWREYKALIDAFYNSPSIVAWVPFNEGWGQFDTNNVLSWTKKRDPTRLVDGPSGWADRQTGDLHDVHRYPGPGMPLLEENLAAVLGEF